MVNQLLRANVQSVAQECTRLDLLNFLEDPSKEYYPSRDNKKTPANFGRGFFMGFTRSTGLYNRSFGNMRPDFPAYHPLRLNN
jgi:hypothetical protein